MSRIGPRRNRRTGGRFGLAACGVVVGMSMAMPTSVRSEEPDRGEVAWKRAAKYLSREVPAWYRGNRCRSCHNNGDGARALFEAVVVGEKFAPGVLDDTETWLSTPDRWPENGGRSPASDKTLARLQFTLALSGATRSGRIADRATLDRAMAALAAEQKPDGAWPGEEHEEVGSPTTYGVPLATALFVGLMRDDPGHRFDDRVERSRAWFRARKATSVLDASSGLLALDGAISPDDDRARDRFLAILERGQSDDGGWGAFANDPPEVFDTAVAMIALDRVRGRPAVAKRLSRGRAFLVAEQRDDGSWTETTRPPGGVSYAQRVSTTAWAAQALRVTSGPGHRPESR